LILGAVFGDKIIINNDDNGGSIIGVKSGKDSTIAKQNRPVLSKIL
jgi:hypothetical protein